MENTEQNKVKFFAQYWGQKVFINPILTPKPVSNIYIFEYPEPEDIEQEYLELKPLSSITDEDSRQLGFRDSDHFKIDANEYGRKDELRLLGYAIEWAGLSVEKQIEYAWIKLI